MHIWNIQREISSRMGHGFLREALRPIRPMNSGVAVEIHSVGWWILVLLSSLPDLYGPVAIRKPSEVQFVTGDKANTWKKMLWSDEIKTELVSVVMLFVSSDRLASQKLFQTGMELNIIRSGFKNFYLTIDLPSGFLYGNFCKPCIIFPLIPNHILSYLNHIFLCLLHKTNFKINKSLW